MDVADCLLLGLAAIASVGAVCLASVHPLRLRAASWSCPASFQTRLRNLPPFERAAAVLGTSDVPSWAHDLAAAMMEAPSAEAKVAAINESVFEIDRRLGAVRAWPLSAVRLVLLSAGSLAALGFAFHPTRLVVPLVILAAGAFSALLCGEIGRRAQASLESTQRAVDALVAILLELGGAAVASEAPSRSRRNAPSFKAIRRR